MGLFNREKKIQASGGIDGNKEDITMEALLSGERINTSIPGTQNAYKNYESQVRETYRKYNGRSDFGVSQVRATVDLRTAMIAGEGISVAVPGDDKLQNWIEKYLFNNRINNAHGLFLAVKGSEMAGQALYKQKAVTDKNGEVKVEVIRMPYYHEQPYKADYVDGKIKRISQKVKDSKEYIPLTGEFTHIRTGGDDGCFYGPTTKIGVVLTDCENYDRAIKDMRRNNHITARVTPVFKTEDENQAKSIKTALAESKWKIGKAYAGSADFKYVTPGTGAHEPLQKEMVATIKNIVATTSVPVHWLGYSDLMSNRSTADSLYEMIKHGTSLERSIWETALYEMILKAQELYIDAGGTEITKINNNFQVRLPLLDFSNFLETVRALSLAYGDEAISMEDYRNSLPGIDPIKTKKAIEAEKEPLGPTVDIEKNIKQMEEIENGETDNS